MGLTQIADEKISFRVLEVKGQSVVQCTYRHDDGKTKTRGHGYTEREALEGMMLMFAIAQGHSTRN